MAVVKVLYKIWPRIELYRLRLSLWYYRRFRDAEWFNNASLFFSEKDYTNDCGELHLGWFYDSYATEKIKRYLPIFDKAYTVLTERKNFSRKNAFGEMHGDNYIWIEKCEHSKVIVHETQSCLFLMIRKDSEYFPQFHIRELYSQWAYNRSLLRGLTVSKFRKFDFKTGQSQGENNGFYYGDSRDKGFICSTESIGEFKLGDATKDALSVIGLMKYWEHYLDDPSELE